MSFNEWVNRNQKLATIIFSAVLVVALVLIVRRITNPGGYEIFTHRYYYDVSTGELFVGKSDLIPPIRDGKGVIAQVFSCTDCSDESALFIGFLETYTEKGKQALLNPPPPSQQGAANNTLAEIAGSDGPDGAIMAAGPAEGTKPVWFSAGSATATKLRIQNRKRCGGGKKPISCLPRDRGLP